MLHKSVFAKVQSVLYEARGLHTLVLRVGSTAKLLVDLVKPGPLPVTNIQLDFEHGSYQELDTFVRAFPLVSNLTLASAQLDSNGYGYVRLDHAELESISHCPLTRLVLDTAPLEPVSLALLGSMETLTELWLTADDASELGFVKRLTRLRSLTLCLHAQVDDVLVLPPSVEELRCFSRIKAEGYHVDFLDLKIRQEQDREQGGLRNVSLSVASLLRCQELLRAVHTLSCRVTSSDITGFQRLLCTLSQLRRLELRQERVERNTLSLLSRACHVTILELRDVEADEDLSWLSLFPDLAELRLQRGSLRALDDAALMEAFRLCPKLLRLVDKCEDYHSYSKECSVVTVGRTAEGHLIKRKRDLVARL